MANALKPVLIVMTSHGTKGEGGGPTGFYLSEVTHPLAVLEAAEIPVRFASILGGEPPVDGLDLDDATNARYWQDDTFRQSIRQTLKLADIVPSEYSAIFFAGGHGAMWDFTNSAAVDAQTRAVWEQGGLVGAVCHGPAALVNVKLSSGDYLVAGRKVAAFTDAEERAVGLEDVVPYLLSSTLAKRGALMQSGPEWKSQVAVDGKLISGQNPQSATGVAKALRDQLLDAG